MKRIQWLTALVGIFSFSGLVMAQTSSEVSVPGEYLIELRPGTNQAQLLSLPLVNSARPVAQGKYLWVNADMSTASTQVMEAIKSSPFVRHIQPNYIYRINSTPESPQSLAPNDEKYGELWGLRNSTADHGLRDMDAERAWFLSTGSKEVVVAVVDTGVDYTHEDLKNNMWVNTAEKNGTPGVDDDGNGYVDDIYGYDAVASDGDPMDGHSHGTHCAGTIGAEGNNGIGVAGMNWNTQIMAVRAFDDKGGATSESILNALTYAHKMKAQVVSNSWGGFVADEMVKNLVREMSDNNQLFVAAAGNNGFHTDLRNHYPSGYNIPTVLSVGAIEKTARIADFSNYGINTIDVYAPGADIISTIPNNGYGPMSGTSMATPHIAGLAALILSHEPGLTAVQVKQRIIESAQLISNTGRDEVLPRLANAYRALLGQVDTNLPSYWNRAKVDLSTTHPYPNNASFEWELSIPGAQQISLYFSEFHTERDFDVVKIFDGSGQTVMSLGGRDIFGDRFTQPIAGDLVRIVFTSDEDVSAYGFDLPYVTYDGPADLPVQIRQIH